jgi:hypothetical protein
MRLQIDGGDHRRHGAREFAEAISGLPVFSAKYMLLRGQGPSRF